MTSLIAPLSTYGLALAAGVSLYVGASNLVPEFQAKRDWKLQGSFFAGAALYFLARFVITSAH
jgi:zinc transporter ZupT